MVNGEVKGGEGGDFEGLRDLSGIKLGPVRSGLFRGDSSKFM